MASIESYETSRGETRYMVRYRTPDRKQAVKRGFKRKKDAQKFERDIESSLERGTFISPQAGKILVKAVHKMWLPSQDLLAPRTRGTNISAYNVHVGPRWGEWPVQRITAPEVRKWVSEMQAKGIGRDTILRAVHVLRSICETAVEARRIDVNPVQKIKLPKSTTKRRGYLTAPQVETLVEVQDDDNHKALIYTLAYCGLRISELAALDVADYFPETRRLSVTKAIKDATGTIGATKTYETRRVPVPEFLGRRLAALIEGRGENEPLFLSPGGERIDTGNYRSRVFKPSVERARAKWAEDNETPFPAILPHGLRHTCASLAISVGANVKAVQGLLGHESATVTLNTYADLFPDDLEGVGDALGALHDSL